MILQKPSETRTEYELKKIARILNKIEFFKERNIKEQYLLDLAEGFTLETYDAGDHIFEHGEKGDKFYLIVQGAVDVMIPNPRRAPSTNIYAKLRKPSPVKIQTNLAPDAGTQAGKFLKTTSSFAKKVTVQSQNVSGITTAKVSPRPSPKGSRRPTPSQTPPLRQVVRSDTSSSISSVHSEGGYIRVAELNKDKVFGELALIKNQPRAATIVCSRSCALAVLDRAMYKKVLLKVEQKRLNKMVDFLHSLPFFKNWTRTTISKFQYFFTHQTFQRNHVVYREGDPLDYVYLIYEGEFEVSQIQRSEKKRDIDLGYYLQKKLNPPPKHTPSHHRCSSSHIERLSIKPKAVNDMVKRVTNLKLMLLSDGNFFGEDDALSKGKSHYSQTVRCISQTGSVLKIKCSVRISEGQDLIKRVSISDETFKLIIENVIHKREIIANRSQQGHRFYKPSICALDNPFKIQSPPKPTKELKTEPALSKSPNMSEFSTIIDKKEADIASTMFFSSKQESVIQSSKARLSSASLRSLSPKVPRTAPQPRNQSHGRIGNRRTLSKSSIKSRESNPAAQKETLILGTQNRFFPRDGSNFEIPTLATVESIQIPSPKQNFSFYKTMDPSMKGSQVSLRNVKATLSPKSRNHSQSNSFYLPCAYTLYSENAPKRLIPKLNRGPLRESLSKIMALRNI